MAPRSSTTTQKFYYRVRERAASEPNEAPARIIQGVVNEIQKEELLMRLPERQTMLRSINIIQNRQRPPLPRNLDELNISHPYDKTLRGDSFLQYDSNINGDRLIIFYTPQCLRLLCESETIFSDGTFKTSPRLFFQLYTVHGLVGNEVYPLAYCLTTRKTERSYTEIFSVLQEHAARANMNLNPLRVIIDFEQASFNALRTVFPNSTISECLFHFSQSVWRKATSLGLTTLFHQSGEIRRSINMIFAVPFLPPEDLVDEFVALKDILAQEVVQLWQYVDEVYVRGNRAWGRRRAIISLFLYQCGMCTRLRLIVEQPR